MEMANNKSSGMSRRSLLNMIGTVAGSAVMYHAMTELGHAGESGYGGPVKLSPPPPGTSVLILGAGLAGMVAAMEMRDAGYKVQVLEYNGRAGGRNWSLYGGDVYAELGGFTQKIAFAAGHYFNPGPWRVPYHHYGILSYARRLKVALEPFTQVNYNAYLHSTHAYGGKPQRYRTVQADFQGHVAELLSKSTRQKALDGAVTREDQEILLAALKEWGALDANYNYAKGLTSSDRRGYASDPGGGLNSLPVPSEPLALSELLKSKLWGAISAGQGYEYQSSIFQPAGGMGMIGRAFGKALEPLIQYNCKVTGIHQDAQGITATYIDSRTGDAPRKATAGWCVCTIPASILSQIPMNIGAPMRNAINQLSYSASVKTGLQFKRRFWEEDEQIYGGITYTNQPSAILGYPNDKYFTTGPGVILGSYIFGPNAFLEAAKPPRQLINEALDCGQKIHKQYKQEFDCGAAVVWHRVPWALGCAGQWTDERRAEHYDNLCAMDGRIVLAGEHASRLPAWQEGAVTSALDAISRLHKRVLAA